jgi:hypothetical protein
LLLHANAPPLHDPELALNILPGETAERSHYIKKAIRSRFSWETKHSDPGIVGGLETEWIAEIQVESNQASALAATDIDQRPSVAERRPCSGTVATS